MTDVVIEQIDNVYNRVVCNKGILHELIEEFAFHPPGYKHMPKYKAGVWDGLIYMINQWNHTFYVGITKHIADYAKSRGYTCTYKETTEVTVPRETVMTYAENLHLHSDGNPITPRAHQYLGLYHILNTKRAVLLSPTASGKSLSIYMGLRYLQDVTGVKKTLIVVPTTSLTNQMKSDFADYSSKNGWDAEKNCHLVYAGQDKHTDKPITISTWQSIFRMGKKFFEQFDAVFVDEAHTVKATSLVSIMEKCQCDYKIGLTGTLDDAEAHTYVIEGLLGPAKVMTTTRKLINKGEIAKLHINAVMFEYADIHRKIKRNYQDEIKFLLNYPNRNNALANLVGNCKGNSLMLFLKLDHGELLFKKVSKANPGRKVFLVNGGTAVKDREAIRVLMENETDAIIIASYGVFSTGINIKNIHHVILASPTKSKIRVLQSIGRGLRLHHSKERLVVWDIADDLSWKKRENYSLIHFIKRMRIYIREEFDYSMVKIKLR